MRVTQFTQYNNFILNQQKTLNELNKIQTQISTGEKIENIYDDPVIYTKYLQLNEEINTFTQVKSSANFAQTFANQTDTTLNDFVTTLGSFKTNLLKAANDTNDETSRKAIVSELQGLLEHLKDLANTSIDGKYLFSGSKFNVKPIGDDYEYQGNAEKVKAFLGAGVEREYNIDGSTLFLGRDNDYKKHLTTNVFQFDKMKANPQFVVRGADGNLYIDKHLKEHSKEADSQTAAVEEPVNENSQIRMLTGVEDVYDPNTDSYSDGTSYFYIKGKTPSGEAVNAKIALSNSDTVGDLLNKIGEAYGNTASGKVVDVTLNDMGEIEIKDLSSGKMLGDFYMVASDRDEASIEDLAKNGDYIVEFQKSNFVSVPTLSSVKASNAYFDNRVYKFGTVFKTRDTHRDAIAQDQIKDIIGDGVNLNVSINSVTYSVTSDETLSDLIEKIKNAGYNAYLKEGELIIEDPLQNADDQSDLDITMSTTNGGSLVNALTAKDSLNFEKLFMDKNGNEVKGNVSQVNKDYKTVIIDSKAALIKNENAQTYADENTTVIDTMGKEDLPQVLEIRYRDLNGTDSVATVTLDDDGSTFTVGGNTYHIYDDKGETTPAHDTVVYESYQDPQTCQICQKEIHKKGVTYRQLGDVVSMLLSGNLPDSDSADAYKKAVDDARREVQTGMDYKGRFYARDLNNSSSKMDLSIYDADDESSLYFQANNAITINEAQVDFFTTLQNAITAVENGNNFADFNKDPRNFGIQGAIEAIDHITDHVRREHAKIGAVSNEFKLTIERTDMLSLNVKQLQSENIDTDIGEATMQLNSLQTSYQALLASIARVSKITLLNYL